MKNFIDVQEFIKELIGDNAKIYSFPFDNKREWKTHTLNRYGYCQELLKLPTTHLIKEMANKCISVATYNDNTNEGVVLDRRETIRWAIKIQPQEHLENQTTHTGWWLTE